MKQLLTAVLLVLGFARAAGAQTPSGSPLALHCKTKSLGKGLYELHFEVKLGEGWHIFSQKPGDEFLIPPSFQYVTKVELKGDIREDGTLHTVRMEGIDSPVNYYEGSVDFVQTVKFSGKGNINGVFGYQICDASHCLAPAKLPFVFELK